jgi:hypothetical protein
LKSLAFSSAKSSTVLLIKLYFTCKSVTVRQFGGIQ